MKLVSVCNRVIEYFFYLLFFSVPLYLSSSTSELFEFNKLWLTFGITIIIVASWLIKMAVTKKFKIQRTPLDIPIGLFLLSQIISTIVSIDPHTSIWGYYSRFNGGLLSIIAYVLLYYAFASNLAEIKYVKRILKVSLFSGFIVAMWGLPSHFGYDPTCLLFRGTFDVSCWTSDFQPKVRIFSTLGQPDWMSAYLAVLIPISIGLAINNIKSKVAENNHIKGFISFIKNFWPAIVYLLLTLLFYLDLLYTASRSGALAVWFSVFVFAFIYFFIQRNTLKGVRKTFKKHFLMIVFLLAVLVITFFNSSQLGVLGKFSYQNFSDTYKSLTTKQEAPQQTIKQPAPQAHVTELGGTDSTKIRAIVWEGALNVFLNYPIFGSGVETFAYSYYQFRPVAHNMTSEYNFLYNKAHNEFLNYLATTGIVGLLTYLSIIFWFLWLVFSKGFEKLKTKELDENKVLILALTSSFISILITNFFGFSVVIINIYLFIIPLLSLILMNLISSKKFGFELRTSTVETKPKAKSFKAKESAERIGNFTILFIIIVVGISCFFLYKLYIFREADKAYAYGSNLNRAQQYQQAYSYLTNAYSLRPSEPVIASEVAYSNAIMTVLVLQQSMQQPDQATQSAQIAQNLAQEAVKIGTQTVTDHPNNVVFWKNQTKIYYTLAQADNRYLPMSLEAIKKAAALAPTDANINYNLGILYGQNGQIDEAIKVLEKTTKLKPDYRDAYYALGIFYHQAAIDESGKVVKPELNQKAIDTMKYILSHISEKDDSAKDAIKTWQTN